MAKTIPLIRAANLLPLVRWTEANRHRSELYLAKTDLDYWYALSPMDPIPLRSGIDYLRMLARDHGPDIGVRIVNQASVAEIGFIGAVALGARNPVEAFQRLSFAMPLHSSHETFRVGVEGDQLLISHALNFQIDDESLHAVHVLLISMLQQVLRFTGQQPPLLRKVEMMAHPQVGLSHISTGFSDRLFPSESGMLTVSIDLSVAQVPYQAVARDRSANPYLKQIPPLTENHGLAASVRPVIAAMLHGGEPTIERIALTYGGSVRSLQRRLSEEGTSFSEQLDLVRRELVMSHLDGQEDASLSELSERLGYSGQSALTRAVRRLTGQTPSQLASERGLQ
ncbi:helix-turn-helix transcriptional regulator [Lutimaribacter marinistellae]|uniref:Helix-turn-helix transcriptional regulator n=1 Tax=Lutimaribacter marinistellae TaxID=1820329 RepID=A0ABV7TCF3_9RHOB